MSMVKALALSPLVEDPGADRHGKVVFFDVLGLFSVVYPERLAVIFNSLMLVGCAVSLCSGISLKPQQLGKIASLDVTEPRCINTLEPPIKDTPNEGHNRKKTSQ